MGERYISGPSLSLPEGVEGMTEPASVFDHPEFDDHEQVLFCRDAANGLFAIIAVHSTALGPAAGGCRMRPYPTAGDALTDVLRLSRGMSYKSALAGLPLGGGKSVIMADPARIDKADLLRSFSRQVQSLGGRYWTAIDVGVDTQNADVMAEQCDYIFARASQYPDGFNPSHFTSLGGFTGIRAVVRHVLRRDDLHGVRVAVQGLGNTGHDLCRQLHDAGAELVIADVNDAAVRAVVDAYGAVPVDPALIHAQDVDVFAPCALGGVINDETVPQIRAKAVCGLANNQLQQARHATDMESRGITYVPDYVVNSGGMIGASTVIFATPDRDASLRRILGLHDTILSILEQAAAEGRPAADVADEMARARIATAANQPTVQTPR
jgi:leucine dehydrogenase